MASSLETSIGYVFRDPALLEQALVHSSYCNEHGISRLSCNERLEFLGDAVLELSSSRYFFDAYPDHPEGQLSRLRASCVCEPSLGAVARNLGLGPLLKMGRGERKTGGAERDSILSDALEAVIGAVYLDSGFEEAERFVRRVILPEAVKAGLFFDAKTELQELVQADGVTDIRYELLAEDGPEHSKRFRSAVYLDGSPEAAGEGSGPNKKSAEQAAAADALSRLKS